MTTKASTKYPNLHIVKKEEHEPSNIQSKLLNLHTQLLAINQLIVDMNTNLTVEDQLENY